jgi:membrane-associated phospholipid phosphatase
VTAAPGFSRSGTAIWGTAADPPAIQLADDDVLFEYGYIWLPYALAALALLVLGAVAVTRRRRGDPGVAELLLTAGGLLAVLAAVVAGLADGATENNGLAFIDPPVWQWMIEHRTPTLTTIAIVITEVGSTISMTVIATATIIYLLVQHRRGDAALVAVVAAGAGLLVRFGKATVGRERPPESFRLVTETNESFPSGHALASAAILGVVLVVLIPSISNRSVRIGVIVGVGLFALLIGLSRLYLGVHWATDVIGGWITGLAWLVLCLTVRQVWRQTHGRPESLVLPDAQQDPVSDEPAGPVRGRDRQSPGASA